MTIMTAEHEPDHDDGRDAPRRRTLIAAKIRYGAVGVDCIIRNISDTGAKVEVSESIVLPARFEIAIPQKNVIHQAELRWRRGSETGIAFVSTPQPAHADGGGATGTTDLGEEKLRTRIRQLEQEIVRLRARVTELGG